jgi:glycosyltransferase involved in cell wall biosynthesis
MNAYIPRGVVIATHNRADDVARCVDAIDAQAHVIVVVDNATRPPLGYADFTRREARLPDWLIYDDEQPPNLSRLWNVGIARLQRTFRDHEVWDVAVLNDDAVPPPGWFDACSAAMRSSGANAASSDPFDRLPAGQNMFMGADVTPSVTTRLAGWAHVLRGEERGQWPGARYDARFRWWCGDDDVSHRARITGGLVHVGGFPVPNLYADQSTTGVLAEQSGIDMAAFVDKWNFRPW